MNVKTLKIGAIVIGVLLVVAVVLAVFKVQSLRNEVSEARSENEQLQLSNEQLKLSNEYAAINNEFQMYENQAIKLANDSILAKYTAAKNKVEDLMKQMKNERNLSQAKIKQLQDEIGTLKGLLRHYVDRKSVM